VDALYPSIAGVIAGILTYADLDTVFDAPPHRLRWGPWWRLLAWWWGFVLVNAGLAVALFYGLRETYFKDLNPWIGPFVAGFGYPALIRLQWTTLPLNGKNTPIGIETGYEAAKNLVHRRINRIIRTWRVEQSEALAQADLATLRERALLMVGSDALLTEEQRNADTNWINQTASHKGTPELDRRRTLALFIITERRASPP
jgi:hypothetical protein